MIEHSAHLSSVLIRAPVSVYTTLPLVVVAWFLIYSVKGICRHSFFPKTPLGLGSRLVHTREGAISVWRDIGVALPAKAKNKRLNAAGPDVWWVGFLAGGGYHRSGCVVDGIPLRVHFSKD